MRDAYSGLKKREQQQQQQQNQDADEEADDDDLPSNAIFIGHKTKKERNGRVRSRRETEKLIIEKELRFVF